MERCPNCGRGGKGKHTRLSAPALLTLAAEEVSEGVDMKGENLQQLVLLRKYLRRALDVVEIYIDAVAQEKQNSDYAELRIAKLKKEAGL